MQNVRIDAIYCIVKNENRLDTNKNIVNLIWAAVALTTR